MHNKCNKIIKHTKIPSDARRQIIGGAPIKKPAAAGSISAERVDHFRFKKKLLRAKDAPLPTLNELLILFEASSA